MPALHIRDQGKTQSTGVIAAVIVASLIAITATAIFAGNRLYKARHGKPSKPFRLPSLPFRKKPLLPTTSTTITSAPISNEANTNVQKSEKDAAITVVRPETSVSEAANRYWDADSVGKPLEARTRPPPSRGLVRRTDFKLPSFSSSPFRLSPIFAKFNHTTKASLANFTTITRPATAASRGGWKRAANETKPINEKDVGRNNNDDTQKINSNNNNNTNLLKRSGSTSMIPTPRAWSKMGLTRSASAADRLKSESRKETKRSESKTENIRSESRNDHIRSESRIGNPRSDSRTGNVRSESRNENPRSESRTENPRADSRTGYRSESRNGLNRSGSGAGAGRSESRTRIFRPTTKHVRTNSKHISAQIADIKATPVSVGLRRTGSRNAQSQSQILMHSQSFNQGPKHSRSNSVGGGGRIEIEKLRWQRNVAGSQSSTTAGNTFDAGVSEGTSTANGGGRKKNPLSVITDLNWMEHEPDLESDPMPIPPPKLELGFEPESNFKIDLNSKPLPVPKHESDTESDDQPAEKSRNQGHHRIDSTSRGEPGPEVRSAREIRIEGQKRLAADHQNNTHTYIKRSKNGKDDGANADKGNRGDDHDNDDATTWHDGEDRVSVILKLET